MQESVQTIYSILRWFWSWKSSIVNNWLNQTPCEFVLKNGHLLFPHILLSIPSFWGLTYHYFLFKAVFCQQGRLAIKDDQVAPTIHLEVTTIFFFLVKFSLVFHWFLCLFLLNIEHFYLFSITPHNQHKKKTFRISSSYLKDSLQRKCCFGCS